MHILTKSIFALMAALLAPSAAFAQAPSANDEIIRLIAAKMPESIIIAKVNDLRGGLDKSTDALIKLREAGASDMVLAAVLSDKAIAVAAPGPAAPIKPSISFQNADIRFEALLISTDMIRVNVAIHNSSEKPIYLWNSSNQGLDCMGISLTDELGNDFKCSLDPFWAIDPSARGNGGKTIMPSATMSVQYGFTRTGMTAGKSFNFSAMPFLTIAKGDPEEAAKQIWRNENYNYENLGISFSDLPAKVRPVGK
jgi:hypothetical protein